MGTSSNLRSHFVSVNFDLDYYSKKEFKRTVKNIIYDALDDKWFDFTRENYIEEQLNSKYKGEWYVKIIGMRKENEIDFDEPNTIIYFHLINEGGLLSDTEGEYFYIKRKRGSDSDCLIF